MPHKLLLADDSVTIQRVIELTFADEDVQVTAVGNGREAIESVQRDRPDIVLADVGMPEKNGYEVAAFIKGDPALAHIPVVLLTGAFEPVDEGRARSVGCDGVLVKPFEPQIVISRVKDLLAGRQPAGMWTTGPVAQGSVRETAPPAPAAPSLDAPAPATPAASDPLEAYFDHLDAAFSTGTTRNAPDLSFEPLSIPVSPALPPASPVPSAPAWAPEPVPEPQPVPAFDLAPQAPVAAPSAGDPARVERPSLVEAFAALLSAEQRVGLSPSAAPAVAQAGAPMITADLIEAVAARVVARLTDQSRHTILDAAERLVREEIERIKANQ